MAARFSIQMSVFCLLALLLLSSTVQAQGVGQVTLTKGEFTALSTDKKVRTLPRGADVHVGDTLRTGAGAAGQVRFSDGTILSLREQSEFRVDDYRFGAQATAVLASVATLLKGGYRTMTGHVAKRKPEAYRVHTPIAILGVRGTNYEALLLDGLYVAVWQGTVVIQNKSGVTLVGEGTPYKFAFVRDIDTNPQLLTQPPPPLSVPLDIGGTLGNLPLTGDLPVDNLLPGGTPSLPDTNLNLPLPPLDPGGSNPPLPNTPLPNLPPLPETQPLPQLPKL
jgi:hypothetical protein